MTIAVPTSGGWTFNATLEADEFHMLWLNSPSRVTGKPQGRYLLAAALKIAWRIVESTLCLARGHRARDPAAPRNHGRGAVSGGRRNSSCRIHGGAIVAGVAAARGPKTGLPIPKQIVIDGPIVTRANAPGMLWMEEQFLI